jgi:small subunit ribosomal protein S5
MVKACFAALVSCASPRSVAARRSKKVSEIIGKRETGDAKAEARE